MSSNEELLYILHRAMQTHDKKTAENYWQKLYQNNLKSIQNISYAFKEIYAKSNEDNETIDREANKAFLQACQSYDPNFDLNFDLWMTTVIKKNLKNMIHQKGLVNQYDHIS
ncbi:hypothetical protein QYZ88_003665 [Lachnospiraceae bacterium C1.1]|nr:hypothetical protein [Lachnospiraceae bacterium C1.1]